MKARLFLSAPFILTILLGASCAPRYYYLRPVQPPLTLENIVNLAKGGASEDEIIRKIDETGTVISLRAADILRLNKEGVGEKVIDHLIQVREWTLLSMPRPYTEQYLYYSPGRDYPAVPAESRTPDSRPLIPVAVH